MRIVIILFEHNIVLLLPFSLAYLPLFKGQATAVSTINDDTSSDSGWELIPLFTTITLSTKILQYCHMFNFRISKLKIC